MFVDSGKKFNNETVKDLLKLHKIQIHFTTPEHHKSSSIVKKFSSTIIEHSEQNRLLKETH